MIMSSCRLRHRLVLLAVLSAGACRSGSERPAPWSAVDALPILECRPTVPATLGSGSWESDSTGFTFQVSGPVTGGAPYALDSQAVAAAKEWLSQQFAVDPEDLRVQAIDPSASGSPEPVGDSDRGHTIVLMQLYRGIPTYGVAVVYMSGKRIISVVSSLHDYAPVAGSAKVCVTAESAVAAWRAQLQAQGASEESLARYDAAAAPRLCFEYSIESPADVDRAVPSWRVVPGLPYMVNGHSGKIWIND